MVVTRFTDMLFPRARACVVWPAELLTSKILLIAFMGVFAYVYESNRFVRQPIASCIHSNVCSFSSLTRSRTTLHHQA